jgi:hypothetical protein
MSMISHSLRLLPVAVNTGKINSVRFGVEPLRPEQAAAEFVTRFETWETARQIQVGQKTGDQFQLLTPERQESALSSTNPGQVEQRRIQDRNTLKVPGEWARLSTAPRVYELSTENTGETLKYVGPGCFSIASATYKNTPNGAPYSLEGELLDRAQSLIYRLAALTGEQ